MSEWKKFLDYGQKNKADGKTEVQLEEQQSAETTTQVKLWKDYRAYQQVEVDNAKQWVEFWQRQVKYFEDGENLCALQGADGEASGHHSEAEDARSYGKEAREQVGPPESRLKWVEEQLSAILPGRAVSTTEISTSNYLEDQAKLPKRASRSAQTTFKDLISNRSNGSAPRSNHDKKKKHASAGSALDPIHSSKVSKAFGRKAPRLRRRPKILAEQGDNQKQGSNTILSPLLPANVAPRRSRRLFNNQKRSGALESSLAVDLGKSARSPPIILRKSNRISKQKERMSTSTSDTAVNLAVILKIEPLRSLSRSKPKDFLVGNKSDTSSVKPRGISKRQGSNFSRNRTKIHI